jgi:hypothetical protein
VGKLLDQDYREGGHLAEHLMKYDAQMSRDSFEALAKRDLGRDSLGSAALDAAVAKVMKAEPALNRHEAVRKVMNSPEADELYAQYEEQQTRIAKALNGKPSGDDDADDGDADDDDAAPDKEKRKARGRMKCKGEADSVGSAAGHDSDSDDEEEDDDDDTDDKEKLRRKAVTLAKALGLSLVASESIRKAAPIKLCPGCAAENTLTSRICHDCSKPF